MLRTNLLHPEILHVLGSNGHGSRILIADMNFPFSTGVQKKVKKVFLNLAPGILTVTEVLKVLKEIVPIESYAVMLPPDEAPQEIHKEFADILGKDVPVTKLKRFEFYNEAQSNDTCLVIATGEIRRFANILFVLGVIKY